MQPCRRYPNETHRTFLFRMARVRGRSPSRRKRNKLEVRVGRHSSLPRGETSACRVYRDSCRGARVLLPHRAVKCLETCTWRRVLFLSFFFSFFFFYTKISFTSQTRTLSSFLFSMDHFVRSIFGMIRCTVALLLSVITHCEIPRGNGG